MSQSRTVRPAEAIDRRGFLAAALSSTAGMKALLSSNSLKHALRPSSDPLAAKPPMHAARAKRVIYLHMAGSPPQHDLFDPKPALQRASGKLCPKSFIEGKRLAFIKGHPRLLGSPWGFIPAGFEGEMISEWMPHFAEVRDKVCMIRSVHTDEFNHAPAQMLLHTGSNLFGHASMGAWSVFGLGTENRNLPGFVVMISGGTDPSGGKSLFGAGFLPSLYQGTQVRGFGDPVFYLSDPEGMNRAQRRRSLDTLRDLNRMRSAAVGDPEIESRTQQYELAYRMQASVPEAMDLGSEPEHIRSLYGATPGRASFANHCLYARRLVERGVRFVQLYDWGWDIHGTAPHDDLITQFPKKCKDIDRSVSALLVDLEQRGLLDDTLVVWGGEFGRTPMNEARNRSPYLGRDHHPGCFTVWMAGGGVKPGSYGATDELGFEIAKDPVHVRDLQATILHLMGLNPHRLHYLYQGLEQRLIGPDDFPNVLSGVLA